MFIFFIVLSSGISYRNNNSLCLLCYIVNVFFYFYVGFIVKIVIKLCIYFN